MAKIMAKRPVCETTLHPVKRMKNIREGIKIRTRGKVGMGPNQESQNKMCAANRKFVVWARGGVLIPA